MVGREIEFELCPNICTVRVRMKADFGRNSGEVISDVSMSNEGNLPEHSM